MFDDLDVFDRDFFGRKSPLFGLHEKELKKTDIRDRKDHYEMLVDLPGFKKEDIQIQVNYSAPPNGRPAGIKRRCFLLLL